MALNVRVKTQEEKQVVAGSRRILEQGYYKVVIAEANDKNGFEKDKDGKPIESRPLKNKYYNFKFKLEDGKDFYLTVNYVNKEGIDIKMGIEVLENLPSVLFDYLKYEDDEQTLEDFLEEYDSIKKVIKALTKSKVAFYLPISKSNSEKYGDQNNVSTNDPFFSLDDLQKFLSDEKVAKKWSYIQLKATEDKKIKSAAPLKSNKNVDDEDDEDEDEEDDE